MNYRIRYGGSLFWLIFWTIFFFPVALILLVTNWSAEGSGKKLKIQYNGSRFWLGFWIILFFPIAMILLIHDGVIVENTSV